MAPLEVLDYLPYPTFVLDVGDDGIPRFSQYNLECQRQSGKTPEDMIGKTLLEVFGPDIALDAFQRHKDVARYGHTQTYEWKAPSPNGWNELRTTLKPMKNEAGKVTHIVGSIRNISLETSLGQAGLHSEVLSAEIQDFVGMAAHDLRTPMRNIEMLVDLIKEGFVDKGDGKLHYIEMLGDVAKRSYGLISQILSATTSLQASAEYSEFDVHSLANDIILALHPEQLYRFDIPQGWLHADKTVVQLALQNLLDNALKHASSGDPALSVAIENMSDNTVSIVVRDNGKGFADPALVFLGGGELRTDSGFGLFGIRRLITARGGAITVKNRTDQPGAEICVTLPGQFRPSQSAMAASM